MPFASVRRRWLVPVLGVLAACTLVPSAAPSARGRTFYVDATHGDDRATGTSPASAWQSLARASVARLEPGDMLLLKRGDRWSGTLAIDSSGTSTSRIVIDAYERGPRPQIETGGCVRLTGSWLTVRHLAADHCDWSGFTLRGRHDYVSDSLASHNVAGLAVELGSSDNVIVHNQFVANDRMSVLTRSPTDDDSGAFGIALNGDRNLVAYNTITGSDAFSYDYGRDGSAIEVYGGRGNVIHHNLAIDNNDFTELGNPRAADNTYAYNVVRSSLARSVFLTTRGSKTSLGPVEGTRVYNNTVYETGSTSQGFVCYAGCDGGILVLRNNIIDAVWKAGYADGPVDENDDLFVRGNLQFSKGPASVEADPYFVDPRAGDLHLRAASPAIDSGISLGYRRDFDGRPVPLDGDGNGTARPDLGAYERCPPHPRRIEGCRTGHG
jgi:Right handed beta helix region